MQQSSNHVGQLLGNYRLVQRLGHGGFAEVYLGEHIHLKTLAAVKLLLTHLDAEAGETFRREAQMIASLRHHSIVQVHDFGFADTTAYLVMDYAPHGTLRQQHPKGSRLPPATVVNYVRQVAEALQYAHEQRIIHRDVKPENMLLGPRYEVLLSDFGIALTAHSSFSQSTQNIAGTIPYMAPEQIQGHARPASDQYALGVVVYEWISGNRPFEGSFTQIAIQHSTTPPPPLRHYLPTIPSEVEQVIMTALHKDPQQRFPSVRAFAQTLEWACQQQQASTVLSSSSTNSTFMPPPLPTRTPAGLRQDPGAFSSAAPTTPFYTPSSPSTYPPLSVHAAPELPPRRLSRRTAVIGIAGVVAVASSGLTWVVLSQKGSHPSQAFSGATASNASTALIPATAPLVTYRGHTDDVMGVDWSPAGSSIATAAQDGTAQVWTANSGKHLFSYSSHILPAQSDDNANAVHWSPDGKRLAIAFADGTAQGVDATSHRALFSYGNGDASVALNALAWSPDGNSLALASSDGTVQVYALASGKLLTRYKGHLNNVTAVAWSHDGKRIASSSDDATVQVWNATTGQALLVFKEHSRKVASVAWSADDSRIASCSWDNTAQIWDAHSGRVHFKYSKHKGGWLNTVAWSPDGKYIASAGEVGTVTGNVYIGTRGTQDVNMHVWEAQSGTPHALYQSFPINALAWSRDGTRVATACTNNVAQVWRVL